MFPGSDRVDADSGGCELDGECFGELLDRALRRTVGGRVGERHVTRDRRDERDRAVPSEVRQSRLRERVRRPHVDLPLHVEVLQRRLGERARPEDTRCVQQSRNRPECVERRFDDPCGSVLRHQIHCHNSVLTATRPAAPQALAVASDEHDLGACFRHRLGAGEPDPGARPGDDRNLALEAERRELAHLRLRSCSVSCQSIWSDSSTASLVNATP